MAQVFNTVDKVNGYPQSLSILVELIWDRASVPVPTHIDEERMCDGPVRHAVDLDGYWSVNLQPNDLIDPDSFYRITHYRDDNGLPQLVYYIYVTDSATPYYWSGGIMIDPPSWFDPDDWGGDSMSGGIYVTI